MIHAWKTILAGVLVLSLAVPAFTQEREWVELFDGNTLTGWKASENPDSITVEDGAIVCVGPRAHLFYMGESGDATFTNFELLVEFTASPGANSGVFFHTRYQETGWPSYGYEAQINNSQLPQGNYYELKKTGSLYGVRNMYKQLFEDDERSTMRIRVKGNRVQIHVNDILLVDYREPREPARTENRQLRRLSSGTIALQCHDPGSLVKFHRIAVKRLPDVAGDDVVAPPLDDIGVHLSTLQSTNFPVMDLHIHLKGGLTLEQALEKSRETGIFYGIAVNCGVGFPVTSDEGVYEFLEQMEGKPVFVGMQAEGREWVNLFSSEAIQQFDYVFTDAMTFHNDDGKRMRLWMPDEVEVGDPEDFMEMLVDRIETILSSEPIDLYVNPTYLPAEIADRYDELWTEDRMERVIQAAVENNIAIEINSRFRLPSVAFVKKAKEAGVKFTLGTNNGDAELGRMEYGLQVVRECNLNWQDMYVSGSALAE